MKGKVFDWIILIFGVCCLAIMSGVFYNIAIFIDEYNLSMKIVFGDYYWLYLYWIMGILTLGICGGALINLNKRNR